jgi:hypothetical protein
MTDRFDTKNWKGRADEMRAIADDTQDPTTKTLMFQIAGDFDRLGEHLYRQASKGKGSEQDRR